MFLFFLLSEAHFHLQGHSFLNNPFVSSSLFRDTKPNDISTNSLFKYDDSPLPNTLTNSFSTNGSGSNDFFSSNKDLTDTTPVNKQNTFNDSFLNNYDPQSNTEPQDLPQRNQTPPPYHFRPSIIIRRIPIYFSSLDENSLDEESSPENPESKKAPETKPSFFKRMKDGVSSFFKSITVFRFLSFTLFAVIFTLIGYHMRKREERSNYVRLPNEG